MLVKPESQLRRIPVSLDPKEAVFIEGVRVCLEMIDLAHNRLQQTLLTMNGHLSAECAIPQGLHTSAMLDAWSLVDSIHRLADLAERFPNVDDKRHIPAFVYLRKNTVAINDLRNFIQHLSEHIGKVVVDGPTWSVWGALSWCIVDSDRGIKTSTYMCGKAVRNAVRPVINPVGKKIRLPVGLITLTQDTVSVCLSDLMEDVERFAATIDAMVQGAFNANPNFTDRYAADVLVSVSLKEADSQSEPAEQG